MFFHTKIENCVFKSLKNIDDKKFDEKKIFAVDRWLIKARLTFSGVEKTTWSCEGLELFFSHRSRSQSRHAE